MDQKDLKDSKNMDFLNDLPEEFREIFSDDNGNKIPDIAENPFVLLKKLGGIRGAMKVLPKLKDSLPQLIATLQNSNKITINGKEYDDYKAVPEEERAELKAQFEEISRNIQGAMPKPQENFTPKSFSPADQDKGDIKRAIVLVLAVLAIVGYSIFKYLT